jgi:hypothetical protein
MAVVDGACSTSFGGRRSYFTINAGFDVTTNEHLCLIAGWRNLCGLTASRHNSPPETSH